MNRKFRQYVSRLLLGLICCWGLSACSEASAPNITDPATQTPTGSVPAQPGKFRDWLATIAIEGLNVHLIEDNAADVLLLEISPQYFEPTIVAEPENGISAYAAVTDLDLALVIGSGFVADVNSLAPVGLLKQNGQTFSPVQAHGYTRIIGINDQGLGVVHRSQFARDLFYSALQAGPGIIEAGRLDISERDLQRPKYFRSVIGICADQWIAAVTLQPSHLRTLGQTLLNFFAKQQWQCSEVVNLAGDREAILALKDQGGTFLHHGDPSTYKTSLFGFKALP